jgi:hypothetical protein
MHRPKQLTRLFSLVIALNLLSHSYGQAPAPPQGLQEKVQAMQQAASQNEQRLHRYQWIETTTITLNGRAKPARQAICKYGPSGNIIKTPIGTPEKPPQVAGGPLRAQIEERRIMQAEQELAAVKELTAMYLPLNPMVLRQALHSRRVDLEHPPSGDNALVINDYAKPGDRLSLELNTQTLQLRGIAVRSYFTSNGDTYQATVQFAILGDGTVYPSSTTIEAPLKRLSITTVNSSFSIPVQ